MLFLPDRSPFVATCTFFLGCFYCLMFIDHFKILTKTISCIIELIIIKFFSVVAIVSFIVDVRVLAKEKQLIKKQILDCYKWQWILLQLWYAVIWNMDKHTNLLKDREGGGSKSYSFLHKWDFKNSLLMLQFFQMHSTSIFIKHHFIHYYLFPIFTFNISYLLQKKCFFLWNIL